MDNDTKCMYSAGAIINKYFVLCKLGKDYEGKKFIKSNISIFDDVISNNPKNVNSWNHKAVAFREIGEIEKSVEFFKVAITICNESLEKNPMEADTWLIKGLIFYNLKDYSNALNNFVQAINKRKKHSMAWNYKGLVYYNLGKYSRAIESFKEARKLFGEVNDKLSSQNVAFNEGLSYWNLREYEIAKTVFTKIFNEISNLNTNNTKYENENFNSLQNIQNEISRDKQNYDKGRVLYYLEDYQNSLKSFCEICKKNTEIYYYIGLNFEKLYEYDKAIEAFNKSIKLNPNSSDAWYRKGLSLRSLSNYIEAKDSFEKALDIYTKQILVNKEDTFALYNKGLILHEIGRFNEARFAFEKYIYNLKKYPNEFHFSQQIGLAYFYNTKYQEAKESFQNDIDSYLKEKKDYLVEYEKNRSEYYKSLASYLSTRINQERNSYLVNNSIKDYLTNERFVEEALTTEFNVYLNKKNSIKAYKVLNTFMYQIRDATDKKYFAEMWNNLGLLFLNENNYLRASKAFDKAIKYYKFSKDPDPSKYAEAWNNKGLTFYYMDKYNEAIDAYEKAIDYNHLFIEAWNNKGLALCKLKKHDEAMRTLETSLKIYPKNIFAHIYIGKLFLNSGSLEEALKRVENSLNIDFKDNSSRSYTWCLKGQIDISKLKYKNAIQSFEEATVYDPINPLFILWHSYARYLDAEFSLNTEKNTLKYKEVILSTILDLEKSLDFFEKNEYYPKYKKWIFSSKLYFKNVFSFIKKPNKNHKEISESSMINAHILYLMGCLYYKIQDNFTAIWKLEECKKLYSSDNINKSAGKLINTIWDCNIKPYVSWWNWWLNSPVNRWLKRVIFTVISLTIFGLLNLRSYLEYYLFDSNSDVVSNLMQTIQFSFIIIILVFILLSPSIESIKGKDIEIEIQQQSPPPTVEFYPFMPSFNIERISNIEINTKPFSIPFEKINSQWVTQEEMDKYFSPI